MSSLDNSQKDSLTMCYTKDSLAPFMEKAIAEYSVYKIPFSILYIDVDGFKGFNDKHGHIFGDEALEYFASSFRLNLEDEDCEMIRYGGDEFVIIFPGKSSKEVYKLATHIEDSFKTRPFLFKAEQYKISFSGGVASYPNDSSEAKDMIEKADQAMYFSKRQGPGRITQYSKVRSVFLKRIIRRVAVVLALVIIFLAARYLFKIDMNTIRDQVASIRNGASLIRSPAASPHTSRVYLKSGNSIEGVITGENETELFLDFSLSSGEGSVIIKKSDIDHIERE